MTSIVEVIPFAVFNAQLPIVAAVKVIKGPLVRGMEVREQSTQKLLGTVVNIQKDSIEELEGSTGGVYAVRIDPPNGEDAPVLKKESALLECSL
jgi:translation initiation factor IF-2